MKKLYSTDSYYYIYRSLKAIILIVILMFFSGAKNSNELKYEFSKDKSSGFLYPDVSFAVMTDMHIADPSLAVKNTDFEEFIGPDKKYSVDSIMTLDYAIKTILGSGVKFVLVCGDLTKDGELVSHQLMARKLKAFTDSGIAVYVIPGNHDINNPNAVSFAGGSKNPVPSISAEDFSRIYAGFGFNAAIMRDDDSLSYVTEPAEGLWLLALDDCRYREYTKENGHLSSGKISQKTADWIASVLKAAAVNKKAVMTMIHHNVVEHWKGQAEIHGSYLINDHKNFSKFLASWNVKVVFTGHYHSQDIVHAKFCNKKFIYDIETGALSVPSFPLRFVEIKNNTMFIRSETVIDKLYPGTDFSQLAHAFVKRSMALEALRILRRYNITGSEAEYVAAAVGEAFFAHYEGDENPANRPAFDKSRLSFKNKIAYATQKSRLDSLWKDISPADRTIQIKL